jgi:hypothetical protein
VRGGSENLSADFGIFVIILILVVHEALELSSFLSFKFSVPFG